MMPHAILLLLLPDSFLPAAYEAPYLSFYFTAKSGRGNGGENRARPFCAAQGGTETLRSFLGIFIAKETSLEKKSIFPLGICQNIQNQSGS
jgi:hypothetical protein